jgi:hypothetical protein
MDRLSGRDRFAMAATGHSQPEPREGAATTLFLTVERGRVHIDRME